MSPRATLVPHEYKPPGTFPCSRSTQLSLGWARETAGHPAGAAGLARQPCRPPRSAKLAPWTCSGSPLLSAGHTHRPAETGSPSGTGPVAVHLRMGRQGAGQSGGCRTTAAERRAVWCVQGQEGQSPANSLPVLAIVFPSRGCVPVSGGSLWCPEPLGLVLRPRGVTAGASRGRAPWPCPGLWLFPMSGSHRPRQKHGGFGLGGS